MGAPTGCVRGLRSSFVIRSFWARCLKCGHLFIATVMIGCVHGRGDNCHRCGSKRYEFVRSLTSEEKAKLEKDVRDFSDRILRHRMLRRAHPGFAGFIVGFKR